MEQKYSLKITFKQMVKEKDNNGNVLSEYDHLIIGTYETPRAAQTRAHEITQDGFWHETGNEHVLYPASTIKKIKVFPV